jgi:hypothetical protein
MSTENHGGMILTGETEELRENPVLVPLIHHKSHMERTESDPEPPR